MWPSLHPSAPWGTSCNKAALPRPPVYAGSFVSPWRWNYQGLCEAYASSPATSTQESATVLWTSPLLGWFCSQGFVLLATALDRWPDRVARRSPHQVPQKSLASAICHVREKMVNLVAFHFTKRADSQAHLLLVQLKRQAFLPACYLQTNLCLC